MGNGHLADVSDHEPGVLGRTVKNHTDDSPPDQTKRTFSIVFVLVMNPITISTQNRTWVSIQTQINHPPSRGKGIIITDPNRHGLLCKTNVIVKEKREKQRSARKSNLDMVEQAPSFSGSFAVLRLCLLQELKKREDRTARPANAVVDKIVSPCKSTRSMRRRRRTRKENRRADLIKWERKNQSAQTARGTNKRGKQIKR